MSDIVERLRNLAQYAYDYEDGAVLDAAAAEIERLRGALTIVPGTVTEEERQWAIDRLADYMQGRIEDVPDAAVRVLSRITVTRTTLKEQK